MNTYLTAFAIRRVLAIGLAGAAAFGGHHVFVSAQEDSVNRTIDRADKTVQRSLEASRAGFDATRDLPKSSAHVKNTGDGTFEVRGGGSKVTVKGLPTGN